MADRPYHHGHLRDTLLAEAERTLRAEAEPAAGMRLRYARGLLELITGRPEAALTAFRAAERLAGLLVTEHTLGKNLRRTGAAGTPHIPAWNVVHERFGLAPSRVLLNTAHQPR